LPIDIGAWGNTPIRRILMRTLSIIMLAML